MEIYVNLDNCRKQYPEFELKLDVRGILHVSGPYKYDHCCIVLSIINILEQNNEELKFSLEDIDTTSDEKWHAEFSIGVKTGYFVKENSEITPENGAIARTFAILRFPNPINPIADELQIYQVKNDEEGHKMALEEQNCFGYTLQRRVDTKVNDKIVWGEPITYKNVVFGKVYTREEVKRMEGDDAQYNYSMMMIFGRSKIVKTRNGDFIPWKEGIEYFSESIDIWVHQLQ